MRCPRTIRRLGRSPRRRSDPRCPRTWICTKQATRPVRPSAAPRPSHGPCVDWPARPDTAQRSARPGGHARPRPAVPMQRGRPSYGPYVVGGAARHFGRTVRYAEHSSLDDRPRRSIPVQDDPTAHCPYVVWPASPDAFEHGGRSVGLLRQRRRPRQAIPMNNAVAEATLGDLEAYGPNVVRPAAPDVVGLNRRTDDARPAVLVGRWVAPAPPRRVAGRWDRRGGVGIGCEPRGITRWSACDGATRNRAARPAGSCAAPTARNAGRADRTCIASTCADRAGRSARPTATRDDVGCGERCESHTIKCLLDSASSHADRIASAYAPWRDKSTF